MTNIRDALRDFVTKRPWSFAIISGVIGSIIAGILFDPIIKFARDAFLDWIKGTAFAAADEVFLRAAGDPSSQLLITIFWMLLAFASAAATAMDFAASHLAGRANNIVLQVEKNISRKETPAEPEIIESWESLLPKAISVRRQTRTTKTIVTIFLIGVGLLAIRELLLSVASLAIANGFHEKMEVVSPIAPPTEISSLNYRWNRIKKVSDYKAVMNDIEVLGAKHGYKLPHDAISISSSE